ncbi:MAG: hypothetical protein RBU37_12680 [Myxococcota bacterium]|nr:hypothetical protein [Myxococcota bacterium]
MALAFLGACAETEDAEVRLSWYFSGTKNCQTSSIAKVRLRMTTSSTLDRQFSCSEGLEPSFVLLGPVPKGVLSLDIELITEDGSPVQALSMRQAIVDDSELIRLALP